MAIFLRIKGVAAGLCALLLGLASSCVTPYMPEVQASTQDYLVVNGFINSQGVTRLELTRSLALTATKAPAVETRAVVTIQAASGPRFALTESPAGTYTSGSLNLNPALTYKLSIATAGGKTYETDYLPVKTTPAIDKVHWRYENDGVQLYVDAHDANRNTTYYRWKYEETWQFTSAIESFYQYNPVTKLVEPRTDDIYHCWGNNISTAIKQTNTTRLTRMWCRISRSSFYLPTPRSCPFGTAFWCSNTRKPRRNTTTGKSCERIRKTSVPSTTRCPARSLGMCVASATPTSQRWATWAFIR